MQWYVNRAIVYLRQHAFSHESVMAHKVKTGHCAQKTREAIEAVGIRLMHHNSAKDYGMSLVAAGFYAVTGNPLAGDVVIIQPVEGHPHGHMAMYDGRKWICDFVQNDMWPGSTYRKVQPPFKIYRHRGSVLNEPKFSAGGVLV